MKHFAIGEKDCDRREGIYCEWGQDGFLWIQQVHGNQTVSEVIASPSSQRVIVEALNLEMEKLKGRILELEMELDAKRRLLGACSIGSPSERWPE